MDEDGREEPFEARLARRMGEYFAMTPAQQAAFNEAVREAWQQGRRVGYEEALSARLVAASEGQDRDRDQRGADRGQEAHGTRGAPAPVVQVREPRAQT